MGTFCQSLRIKRMFDVLLLHLRMTEFQEDWKKLLSSVGV